MTTTEKKKMSIITDSVPVKGGADFTFICKRIPFAVSCTSTLPTGPYNYIDLDLVNKMKIPLLNIKVTRMCLHGHDVRAVGFIEQTVQCVSDGRVQGTVHLKAKVVRDLFNLLNVDCVASTSTYNRLTGHEPPRPPPDYPDEEVPDDVLGGDDDEVREDEQHGHRPEEPDPPDTKLDALGEIKDPDDYMAMPWSKACVPRSSLLHDPLRRVDYRPPVNSEGEDDDDGAVDDMYAAAHGYPDTRYNLADLGPLGPTDLRIIADMQKDHDDRNDRLHAQFGVKSHAPHLYDRGAPQDEYTAKHNHHPRQLRGPRSQRKVTQDEDEYTADELAGMHGYPPGRAGRSRRI